MGRFDDRFLPRLEVGQKVWRWVSRLPSPVGEVFGGGWIEYEVDRLVNLPRGITRRGHVGEDLVVVLVDGTGQRHRTTVLSVFSPRGRYQVMGLSA